MCLRSLDSVIIDTYKIRNLVKKTVHFVVYIFSILKSIATRRTNQLEREIGSVVISQVHEGVYVRLLRVPYNLGESSQM